MDQKTAIFVITLVYLACLFLGLFKNSKLF